MNKLIALILILAMSGCSKCPAGASSLRGVNAGPLYNGHWSRVCIEKITITEMEK